MSRILRLGQTLRGRTIKLAGMTGIFKSRRIQLLLVLYLYGSLLPGATALAWDARGHQAIGAIADRLIAGTPAASQVRAILGGSQGETLQTASVWADCARGVSKRDGAFRYTVEARYAECQSFTNPAGQQELIGFVQRNWNTCRPQSWQEICHGQYHYADVPIQRERYARGGVGTSDHDVVSAIGAAITVLKGGRAPAPFSLNSKEALRVLVHYVGDVHQPLHVGALYLAANGTRVDPAPGNFDPRTSTRGGNRLDLGQGNLHARWDHAPRDIDAARLGDRTIAQAAQIPPTAGPPESWPASWATETLVLSRTAYQGLVIDASNAKGDWPVTEPAGYDRRVDELQRQQLVKAGARLAQLLEAIFASR
jgi:hypothetical protein